MFDVTEMCFTSPIQSSFDLCVCMCVGDLLAENLEVVPAILLEQRILGPALVLEKTMNGCLKSRCGGEVGELQVQRQFFLVLVAQSSGRCEEDGSP